MADFYPANGTALASDLNSCALGDTIYLTAGANYDGNFVLEDKGVGTSFITITTDDLDALPTKLLNYPYNYSVSDETQYRITTAEAAGMPKIRSDSGFPSLTLDGGCHHWKIVGVEFVNFGTPTSSQPSMINLGSIPTINDFPSYITFEKCFMHPKEEVGYIDVNYAERTVEKGCILAGDNIVIRYCAFQGFNGSHPGTPAEEMDTNGILYADGFGPVLIEHCMIESGTQNIWMGGGSGGFAFEENTGNCAAGATYTSATLDNVTGIEEETLISFRLTDLSDILVTYPGDPDGYDPVAIASGYGVGKVATIAGSNITFEPLTSGVDFRRLHIKFGTGVTGGTFDLQYFGQTATGINFSPTVAITNATNTTPIVITSASHGVVDGDRIRIQGVGGNTAANGHFLCLSATTNTFALYHPDDTGPYPIAGTGAYTSGGTFHNRTTLATNIYNALVSLSNLAPADIYLVTPYYYYLSAPTFGCRVMFNNSTATFLLSDGDITIDDTNLTGSGEVTARVEHWWSEGYSFVDSRIEPATGAEAAWGGMVPEGMVIRRNIIAKHELWATWNKSSGELKKGRAHTVEGNVFHGPSCGLIYEVKNQSGRDPWSTVEDCLVENNIWTYHGHQLVAYAPTDGANRTRQGRRLTIRNNLCLHPGAFADASVFGNSTVGGEDTIFTHNTILSPYRMTYQVVGANYDAGEFSGFSQGRGWIVRDNILLYQNKFFNVQNESPTIAPYNHDDIRDGYPDLAADHNLIIDWYGYYDNPEFGDFEGFFANHPDNYLVEEVTSTMGESVEAVVFTGCPADLSLTEGYEYRVPVGSPYHAGGASDASDGTDLGCDIDELIAALGFNIFTGSGIPEPPSNVVIGGRHRVTMQ